MQNKPFWAQRSTESTVKWPNASERAGQRIDSPKKKVLTFFSLYEFWPGREGLYVQGRAPRQQWGSETVAGPWILAGGCQQQTKNQDAILVLRTLAGVKNILV